MRGVSWLIDDKIIRKAESNVAHYSCHSPEQIYFRHKIVPEINKRVRETAENN
jgi:hypothetical protein